MRLISFSSVCVFTFSKRRVSQIRAPNESPTRTVPIHIVGTQQWSLPAPQLVSHALYLRIVNDRRCFNARPALSEISSDWSPRQIGKSAHLGNREIRFDTEYSLISFHNSWEYHL